jgi:hypothetical protein
LLGGLLSGQADRRDDLGRDVLDAVEGGGEGVGLAVVEPLPALAISTAEA